MRNMFDKQAGVMNSRTNCYVAFVAMTRRAPFRKCLPAIKVRRVIRTATENAG